MYRASIYRNTNQEARFGEPNIYKMQIFVSSGIGIPAVIVKAHTWSWAAHAGFVLDNGQILDSTPRRGVRIRDNGLRDASIQFFDVAGLDAVKDGLMLWLNQQVGKGYDWSAILGMALHRDWREDDDWFCSELVASGCEAVGLSLLRSSHLNRITPRDLLLSPCLTLSETIGDPVSLFRRVAERVSLGVRSISPD